MDINANKDLTTYYEQLRQEALSSPLEKVRAKFRGAGIILSSGVASWIGVIKDVYAPTDGERPTRTSHSEKNPPDRTDPTLELTSILAEIAIKNLGMEIRA
ncbi:MAG: hypothetical protein EA358_00875 [Flavobacteriales bacterium]|nr:MAG: hypothetical protein EA358_00875 [Flavobacteriales bacterium]